MALVSTGITILALPIVLAVKTGIPTSAAPLYSIGLLAWAGAVCLVAALIGLRLGTHRVIEWLGHFWGTGWPEDKAMTRRLWLGTVILGLITYALVLW